MIAKIQEETKVVLAGVTLRYAWLFKKDDKCGDKYKCTVCIPKTEKDVIEKLNKAIKAAITDSKGTIESPLRDGDKINKKRELEDKEKYSEYENCFVMVPKSAYDIAVYDNNGNEVHDDNEVYSGCEVAMKIEFKEYTYNGKKGVSSYLISVFKMKDGERLGKGTSKSSADDFDFIPKENDDTDDL